MTRYDLFRRRIAPILFLGVVGLIAYDAWKKDTADGIKGTVVIELGDARPRVRAIEASVIARGEQVGTARCNALPGAQIGPCKFPVQLASPDAELRLDVDVEGTHHKLTRSLHVEDDATVKVEIGTALAAPPPT